MKVYWRDIREFDGDENLSDNLPALIKATNSLENNGGYIHIPQGDWKFSNEYNLPEKVTLFCEGDETSNFINTHLSSNAINLPKTGIGWGIENIKIKSTRINKFGNAINGNYAAHYGTIKNVKIQGHWNKGVYFNSCIGNKIDELEIGEAGGPRIKDKNYGIHLNGVSHFNKFDKCVVRNTYNHCVIISQGDANTFMHCEVGYTGKTKGVYGFVIRAGANVNKIAFSWAEDLDVGWVNDSGAIKNVFMYVFTPECTTPYIDNGARWWSKKKTHKFIF